MVDEADLYPLKRRSPSTARSRSFAEEQEQDSRRTIVQRTNGGFMSHHERWVVESGIDINNRSSHEHKVLSRALDLACLHDQLNVKNLSYLDSGIHKPEKDAVGGSSSRGCLTPQLRGCPLVDGRTRRRIR
eukprot:760702-Amphidinium_carterae.1